MSQLRLDPLTGRWVVISTDRADRPFASVCVKFAVIVWTEPICAFRRARSGESAAAAGAAATMAPASRARANFVVNVIFQTPGIFAGDGVQALNAD